MQEVPFKEEKPSWFFRRTIIFVTLVFCAAMLAYLTLKAPSDALREQLALGFIGLAATVITGYVFGAVVDDANWMKAKNQAMAQGYGSYQGGAYNGLASNSGGSNAWRQAAQTQRPYGGPGEDRFSQYSEG